MYHVMLSFCEATKVDLQSWHNSKKNRNKTHDTTIRSSISLVLSLFVDLINVDMAVQSGFLCPMSEMKKKYASQLQILSFGIEGNQRRKKGSYVSLKDTIPC